VTNIKARHTEKLEIGAVSEELLEKYNRPGPRYTSYPTAPVWKDDFGPADLEESYSRANALETPLSLYMHLPFCESPRLLCACNVSIQKDKSVAIPYLAALKQEIEHVSARVSKKRPVIQFHWGGGTPTYLTPAQLEDLFEHARQRFTFAPDAEIGLEVDPRVTAARIWNPCENSGSTGSAWAYRISSPRCRRRSAAFSRMN